MLELIDRMPEKEKHHLKVQGYENTRNRFVGVLA